MKRNKNNTKDEKLGKANNLNSFLVWKEEDNGKKVGAYLS